MNKLKTAFVLFISTLSFLCTKAQTADELIGKWTTAMGGREKLASIHSVYAENEVSIMNNPASGKTFALNGKGFKSETNFNGQKIIDCYTLNGGWSINPLAGKATAVTMPASQIKLGQLQLDLSGLLFDYAAKGSKVELLGKEDLKGTPAFKIKLTTSSGLEIILYIQDSTYYILENEVKINADGQDVVITTRFSDYRKTGDGFIMPYSSVVDLPGLSIGITIQKIEVNKQIDPAIFDMPKN